MWSQRRAALRRAALAAALLGGFLLAGAADRARAGPSKEATDAGAGAALFAKNCAFCHGRDAQGGETGPDLVNSPLVLADQSGDKIAAVVREGRFGTPMPAFNFTAIELQGLSAFLHAQGTSLPPTRGDRSSVSVADLQTGDRHAGEKYFKGAGTCAKCHSATGDLAGVASRYQGLQLEERMLYPRHVKSRVSVTTAAGEVQSGFLEYLDEFTLGMRDAAGTYHSWRASNVKYSVDTPVAAHVALLSRYSDANIHDLMAYLQTLR